MELLKFHVEVPPNKARNPTGTFSIQQSFPAKDAGVKEAVGGTMRIAIDIVQPHRVAAPGVPYNTHKPVSQHRRDRNNAATTDDDGKKAVAVQVGGRQDNLTTGALDFP